MAADLSHKKKGLFNHRCKVLLHNLPALHWLALLLFVVSAPVTVVADTDDLQVRSVELSKKILSRYQQQRESFRQLHDLVSNGRSGLAEQRLDEVKDYPLAAYLDYLVLRKKVDNVADPKSMLSKVDLFRRKHQDSRSHRRLLGGLKNRAVKLDLWSDYALIAKADNSPIHPCDDLLAGVRNKQVTRLDNETGELWATPRQHTSNCDKAFSAILNDAGGIPVRALWQRTVALLLRGDQDSATELLRYYSKRDREIVRQWIEQIDSPATLLRSPAMKGTSEHHRRLAQHLLKLWAREDLVAASNFWEKSGADFGFNPAEISQTIAEYAVLAAKRGMPEASGLLSLASPEYRGVRYWRIRMALRGGDWRSALRHIDNLPASELAQSRWQYWRARALTEVGYQGAAEKIYRGLAVNFDYHGFLAADQLAISYQVGVSNPVASNAQIERLLDDSRIQRAIEYFLADIAWEGRREWNRVMADASNEQLVAAAQIAYSIGWFDRAYFAMRKTNQKSALAYLFPTPHLETVRQTAALNSVPEALVYGVMRQESGYISDVRSPAGAVGLMQLMPATAKDMGKKLGVAAPRWKLIDGELNIRLGVRYLNFVLRRFDENVALAAAAYNAGPHRVKKWVNGDALPADLWVETIPFDETRDYVKGVLFNMTVSDWRMQNSKQTRLRARMPDVLPLG